MPTPTVHITRQHLADLLRAKCAAEFRRDNLGMSNTAGLSEDAHIDLDVACYQADEAVVKARTAYQDALRAFDAQKTQQAVLRGNEPRADAQLEAAVLGFTPQEGDPGHYSTPCSAAELATLERQAKHDPNVCLLCGWSTTWLDTDNGEVGRWHRKIEMRVCTNPECEEAE